MDYAICMQDYLMRKGVDVVETADGRSKKFSCIVPGHEDANPSADMEFATGMYKCWSQCDRAYTLKGLMKACGDEHLWKTLVSDSKSKKTEGKKKAKPTEYFRWTDLTTGKKHVQYVNVYDDGTKVKKWKDKFRGAKAHNMVFDEALSHESEVLLVVEGASCARYVRELGYDAFGVYQGGGFKHSDTVMEHVFQNGYTRVVLWPDNDAKGERAMQNVGSWLKANRPDLQVDIVDNEVFGYEDEGGEDIKDIGDADAVREIINEAQTFEAVRDNGVVSADIPNHFEPYAIGKYIASQLNRDKVGYVYDSKTLAWFKASETHWEKIEWEDVRADICDRYIAPLGQYAMRRALEEDSKTWKDNVNDIMRRSLFKSPLFHDGVRFNLKRALEAPPTYEIATLSGVIDMRTMEQKPFDFRIHLHKTVCPVEIPMERDEAKRLTDLYYDTFMPRFQNEEMFRFAHLSLGCALMGESHRAFQIWWGPKGCGKTTLAKVLQTAFGSLARSFSRRLFDPQGNHNNEHCDLIEYQIRLAFLPEIQGGSIDCELINIICGGDGPPARRAYGRVDIRGKSVAMPIIYCEAPPRYRNATGGTIERQKTIRFNPLPMSERNKALIRDVNDPNSDIVKGCFLALIGFANFAYRSDYEFAEPSDIAEGTQEALRGQDPFLAFVKDNASSLIRSRSEDILAKYKREIDENTKMSKTLVSQKMGTIGWKVKKVRISGKPQNVLIPLEEL